MPESWSWARTQLASLSPYHPEPKPPECGESWQAPVQLMLRDPARPSQHRTSPRAAQHCASATAPFVKDNRLYSFLPKAHSSLTGELEQGSELDTTRMLQLLGWRRLCMLRGSDE